MKILVYGAGAVGSYLGVMLAYKGHNVTLLIRPDAAPLLEETGLRVTQADGSVVRGAPQLAIGLRRVLEQDPPFDVILLAMKSYDVEAALNPLVAFAPRPFPTVITLQNGIGLEEMVQEALEEGAIIAGSLTTPLRRETPDHVVVEHSGRGLALAPTRRKQHIKPYVQLFNDAGIPTSASSDYRAMKWSKALLNMVGNATSAIVNRHPRIIYEAAPTYRLERKMLDEALSVMDGLGLKVVDLPGAPAKKLVAGMRLPAFLAKGALTRAIGEARGNKMPSFHIDLTAGKRMNEVLYHNGAVAIEGRRLGVPVPVNTALADILLKMARREIDWERYDGNPAQLVQDVEEYTGQEVPLDWAG